MIIYAGIDGTSDKTGTGDEGPYHEEFKNSFVSRLKGMFPDKPFYNRGPYTFGWMTDHIARKAYDHVVENWRDSNQDAVFLAGYSRGAAAVIEVASWLKYRKEPIPVECLILFDAVDRSTALGGLLSNTKIASTVKRVIYVQRNKWTSQSRLSFQNCGFSMEDSSTPFMYRQFHATHGGVGGTPWKSATHPYMPVSVPIPTIWEFGEVAASKITPEVDAIGSAQAWAWASPQIVTAKIECEARLMQSANRNIAQRLRNNDAVVNPRVPNPFGNPPLAPGEKLHIVKPGDSLSKIAITYYGDMTKWEKIYERPWNKKEIGLNPNFIKPDMRIIIPPKSAIL